MSAVGLVSRSKALESVELSAELTQELEDIPPEDLKELLENEETPITVQDQ